MAQAKNTTRKKTTKKVAKKVPNTGRTRRGVRKVAKKVREKVAGKINVTSGAYNQDLPVVGKTVLEVVRNHAAEMDLHPESVAVVNGEPKQGDYILEKNDTLIFVRPAGEKGA